MSNKKRSSQTRTFGYVIIVCLVGALVIYFIPSIVELLSKIF